MATVAPDNGVQGTQYSSSWGSEPCLHHPQDRDWVGYRGKDLLSPESCLELTQETTWNNLILENEKILPGGHLPLPQQWQHIG